jgi:hypothetical protein
MESTNEQWQRTDWPGIYICGDLHRLRESPRNTVKGWFRAFRTMVQDAVEMERRYPQHYRSRPHGTSCYTLSAHRNGTSST